jgi:hypothetical protein
MSMSPRLQAPMRGESPVYDTMRGREEREETGLVMFGSAPLVSSSEAMAVQPLFAQQ